MIVEPRWSGPKTDHPAQTNLIERFRPEPLLSLRNEGVQLKSAA